jgi:glycosyltransferase involved in cell wall biosynthesis/peptidoglycan/xylan/chitin deacetylase (PgdA/CDA1 family)
MDFCPSTSSPMPLRIGILMDHPSPHMTPILDALSNHEGCVAEVIYLAPRSPGRSWGAPPGALPYSYVRKSHYPWVAPLRLWGEMARKRVDVWILNTVYTSPLTLLAVWWLNRRGKIWVYWNEPPRPRPFGFSKMKFFFLRSMLRRAQGLITTGQRAQDFYRPLGNGCRPILSVPYYLNLEGFIPCPLPQPRDGEPIRFLSCCQMISRKGLGILLQACRLLDSPPRQWHLTLVGHGPMRRKLERRSQRLSLSKSITFRGEIPFDQRHRVFADAHVFVLPSTWDGWGMVIPEALASGLPVISTDQVMSAHEFIRDGENGFIIPAKDPEALAHRLEFFLKHSDQIPRMAWEARKSVQEYKAEAGAKRLVDFLSPLANEHIPPREPSKPLPFPSPTWKELEKVSTSTDRFRRNIHRWGKNIWIETRSRLSRRWKPKGGPRLLVYHLVLPEDRLRFSEHLKFLLDYFRILPLREILASGGSPNAPQEFSLALTFDDGFRILMNDCLEILDRFRIQATFFIPTGFIRLRNDPAASQRFCWRAHHYSLPLEPMGPEDLRRLVQLGHEVGSHGVSHISLQALPESHARWELAESRRDLFEWIGHLPEGFAYPYGHTENVFGSPKQWIAEAGYGYAVSLRRGPLPNLFDPFLLPRDHIEGNWSISSLRYFLRK